VAAIVSALLAALVTQSAICFLLCEWFGMVEVFIQLVCGLTFLIDVSG